MPLDAESYGRQLGRVAFDGVGAGLGIVSTNLARAAAGGLSLPSGVPVQAVADVPAIVLTTLGAVVAKDHGHEGASEFLAAVAAGQVVNLAASLLGAAGVKPPLAPFEAQGWYAPYPGFAAPGGYQWFRPLGCPSGNCYGQQYTNPSDPTHAGSIWANPQAAWPATTFPRTMVS